MGTLLVAVVVAVVGDNVRVECRLGGRGRGGWQSSAVAARVMDQVLDRVCWRKKKELCSMYPAAQ